MKQSGVLLIGFDTASEPDIAVVAGTLDDYLDAHPTTALLVVEVAETSFAYDHDVKGPLYAQTGREGQLLRAYPLHRALSCISMLGSTGYAKRQAAKPPSSAAALKPRERSCRTTRALVASSGHEQ